MKTLAIFLFLFVALFQVGCVNSTREEQTETIRQETKQGTEGGYPVNTTKVTREQTQKQSQAQSVVDVSAAVQAAMAGLRGDIPGLIKAAIPESKPIDFAPILSRLDAQKPGAIDWPTIIGGGAAALGAGGYGLLKHQEAKRQRLDADEAWSQNQRALAMLPPDQAAKVLAP
jgi:hypothetical protein